VKGGYGDDNGAGMPEGHFLVDGDYRLVSNSPCINKADESDEYAGQTDISGGERVVYGRADIGAYEYVVRDFSGDERVSLPDFSAFASRWLEDDCGFDGFCGGADYLGDGMVGLDDLLFFSDGWMTGWKPPAIAYWAFDENGGSVAVDGSDFGREGTLLNMDDNDWVEGRAGNALAFDGINDYVRIEGWKGLLGGASRTVCAWINTSMTGPGNIVMWGDPAAVSEWRFFAKGDLDGKLCRSTGGGYVVGTRDVCDGAWHHVAVVLENDGTPDAAEVRLYVDGVEDAITLSKSAAVDTVVGSDVLIGSNRVHYFDGLIDEVRIWDRALSGAEIAELAEGL
jgi:hypothetical protein